MIIISTKRIGNCFPYETLSGFRMFYYSFYKVLTLFIQLEFDLHMKTRYKLHTYAYKYFYFQSAMVLNRRIYIKNVFVW